jgi:hypothetical protein
VTHEVVVAAVPPKDTVDEVCEPPRVVPERVT